MHCVALSRPAAASAAAATLLLLLAACRGSLPLLPDDLCNLLLLAVVLAGSNLQKLQQRAQRGGRASGKASVQAAAPRQRQSARLR